MPFPSAPRVQYQRNPLEEVICQLRFPAILRIDSEIPASFQERIRREYPVLQERPKANIGHPLQGLPAELAQAIGRAVPLNLVSNAAYTFVTVDGFWRVALARDFIALTARRYETWEDFTAHLAQPLEALLDIYEPAFFTRIGLRYKDVICRSRLGLTDVPWSQLLEPHIAGELSSDDVAADVEQATSQTLIRLGEFGGRVRIIHGLGQETQSGEACYIIDSDLYTETRTEVKDARGVLDCFNCEAGRLFQWCIRSALHDAMEPRSLS